MIALLLAESCRLGHLLKVAGKTTGPTDMTALSPGLQAHHASSFCMGMGGSNSSTAIGEEIGICYQS